MQLPSAANLKSRYPEFTGVADATITLFLSEAGAMVDETWAEGDRAPAVLALAAHYLSLEGYPGRTSAQASFDVNNSGRDIAMRKVGDVAVQFREPRGASTSGTPSLGSTVYGRRFQQLLMLNCPAIAVV